MPVGVAKTSAIVVDREAQCVSLIFEVNLDATRFSMADCIGHRFLPDADQVMDTVRSQRRLSTLNIQSK